MHSFVADVLRDGKVIATGIAGEYVARIVHGRTDWSGQLHGLFNSGVQYVLRFPDGREFTVLVSNSSPFRRTADFDGLGDPP